MSVAEIAKPRRNGAQTTDVPPATLWEALVRAQSEFGEIVRSKPGARSRYAPLESVLDMARPVLSANGLAVMQPTRIVNGALRVATILIHGATGETTAGTPLESEYPVGPADGVLEHQKMGSALTYSRRYSLMSALGVHPDDEDDDGASAGAAGGERPTPARPQQSSAAAKRDGAWERFERTLMSFRDVTELEEWWADAGTQAKIETMPNAWQEQAAEAFEKRQEALLQAGAP